MVRHIRLLLEGETPPPPHSDRGPDARPNQEPAGRAPVRCAQPYTMGQRIRRAKIPRRSNAEPSKRRIKHPPLASYQDSAAGSLLPAARSWIAFPPGLTDQSIRFVLAGPTRNFSRKETDK